MSIIANFEKYFQYPSDAHAYELWQSILEFEDFENLEATMSEIDKMPRNMIGNTLVLQTNGSSSGEPSDYKFSNLIWLGLVESHLRGSPIIKMDDRLFTQKPYIERLANTGFVACVGSYRMNMNNLSHLKEVLNGSYRVCAKGHSWLAASTNPEICEFLKQSNAIAVNTDTELCYNKRLQIPMCDQMIDWSTGVNFWTCEKGHKHILPIFHIENNVAKNLLNVFAIEKPLDDLFVLRGTTNCNCGKKRVLFDFQSHFKNNLPINREIIDELKCCYKYLQFIQMPPDEKLNVFYSSTSSDIEEDLGRLRKLLSEYQCNFVKDKFAYMGRGSRGGKFYTFWRGNCLVANYHSLEDTEAKAKIWSL